LNDAYDKPQGAVQIVLLHQLSLLRYPPAVNLLRTLHLQAGIAAAVVTSSDESAPGAALPSDQRVWRLRFASRQDSVVRRWWLAFRWHLHAALDLLATAAGCRHFSRTPLGPCCLALAGAVARPQSTADSSS